MAILARQSGPDLDVMPGKWLRHDPGKYRRSVTLSLPYPPSANDYWKFLPIRRGNHPMVVPSDAAVKYQKSLRQILAAERIQKLNGHIGIDAVAYPPDNRRRDLDNLWKAFDDSLHRAGLFDDDSQIYDLRIRWSGEKDERGLGFLDVTVTEIG